MAKKKVRRVPKDKSTGLPKKYLSGVTGSARSQLSSVMKQISKILKKRRNKNH